MKTLYTTALLLFLLLFTNCKGSTQKQKADSDVEALLPENDPFNQEFVPQDRYNFEYSPPSPYGSLLEESDDWGTIQDSNIKFGTFIDIDTLHYSIADANHIFTTFIKLEYIIGGIPKVTINKINNTLKKIILPQKYLNNTLQEGTKTFINNIAEQHINKLTSKDVIEKEEREFSNRNLQVSLNITTIRVYKDYYGVMMHLDTQEKDSRLFHLNFNTNTGEIIKLDDILTSKNKLAKQQLKGLVNEKIRAVFGEEITHTKVYPLPDNFYLASNFIALCYNYYEFVPISEGPQTIYIGYDEIKSLLNRDSPYLKIFFDKKDNDSKSSD